MWELCHTCALDDFELQSVSLYDLIDVVREPPMVVTGRMQDLLQAFDALLASVEVGQLQEVKIQIEEMLEAVGVEHLEAQKLDQLDSQKRWQVWAKSALQGGGGRAHRWTRLPKRQELPALGKGTLPHTAFYEEAARLRKLWKSVEQRQPTGWKAGWQHAFDRLEEETICKAAQSFARKAATSPCGFHPRHYAMIEPSLRRTVAILYQVFEVTSLAPSQLRFLVTFLTRKEKGGFRAINLLLPFTGYGFARGGLRL